ncbi:MAG: mechanosensitive ion channel [Alphaproteobacteria bacterium]|nr:mechanosensitive ion channel [Alphaproteobacteria bacterium]MCB9796899.1 mechanosensitive ion channel [Alphaproteobacteria bacterium]
MLPEIPETLQPYMELAQAVLFAILIFIIGWIASKWGDGLVYRSLKRAEVDESLARFLGSIARYLLLAATVIAALQTVGIETTSLSVVLGSAGLAIGLALQGSLSNFASGVMILFFKPIRLDDWVQIDGVTGKVKDIGLFVTTLWDVTNTTYIVPNSAVLGGTISNYSKEGVRRESVSIGVAYGSDLKAAVGALQKAAQRADKVVSEPAPGVAFVGFGASSLDFLVHIYMQPDDYYAALDSTRHAIYEELEAAGVEIPFDQIVIHKAPE